MCSEQPWHGTRLNPASRSATASDTTVPHRHSVATTSPVPLSAAILAPRAYRQRRPPPRPRPRSGPSTATQLNMSGYEINIYRRFAGRASCASPHPSAPPRPPARPASARRPPPPHTCPGGTSTSQHGPPSRLPNLQRPLQVPPADLVEGCIAWHAQHLVRCPFTCHTRPGPLPLVSALSTAAGRQPSALCCAAPRSPAWL